MEIKDVFLGSVQCIQAAYLRSTTMRESNVAVSSEWTRDERAILLGLSQFLRLDGAAIWRMR